METTKNYKKDVVKLNVGGVRYETTWATLACRGSNALSSLVEHVFENRMTATIDNEGFIFIDRCGTTFRGVLNYLRTGDLVPYPGTTPAQIMQELDFFSITLQEEIMPAKAMLLRSRQEIRETLVPAIKENTPVLLEAMRAALSNGEHVLDLIPALSNESADWHISVRRDSGLYKLYANQSLYDQLFLDEVCSLLQDMVFGCPVYFSIKKLKLTDSSVHAKALTVDLTHYLPHFSEKSFRPKANLLA